MYDLLIALCYTRHSGHTHHDDSRYTWPPALAKFLDGTGDLPNPEWGQYAPVAAKQLLDADKPVSVIMSFTPGAIGATANAYKALADIIADEADPLLASGAASSGSGAAGPPSGSVLRPPPRRVKPAPQGSWAGVKTQAQQLEGQFRAKMKFYFAGRIEEVAGHGCDYVLSRYKNDGCIYFINHGTSVAHRRAVVDEIKINRGALLYIICIGERIMHRLQENRNLSTSWSSQPVLVVV